jgi:uncharacterized protein YbaR (Trm112 family)
MITTELLDLLCCPENHQPLAVAAPALVESLNARIVAGELRNRAGHPVTDKIEGGLVREDRKYLYPVRDNIPVLLVDEAIPLS